MRSPSPNSSALAGIHVLVTRAEADAESLRQLLESWGATVTCLPGINIRPPDDPAQLGDALRNIDRYDWLVFTSRNAVRAVSEYLIDLGLQLPSSLKVGTVGPGTASAALDAGMHVHLMASGGTSTSLAEDLAPVVARSRILLPQGDLARPDLAAALRAADAQVDTPVAYRTVSTSINPGVMGSVDVITFFSPSAVDNLVASAGLPALSRAKIVCIGPTTAEAVRKAGLASSAVARERTLESLIDAVLALYGDDHDL